MTRLLSLLVIAFAILPGGSAQTITGTISGTVADDSGAVIPGVEVVLLNERTGEQRKTTSYAGGDFTFPAIPPGTYTVKIDRAGFRGLVRTGIVLTSTQRLSLGMTTIAFPHVQLRFLPQQLPRLQRIHGHPSGGSDERHGSCARTATPRSRAAAAPA